jgi:ATP-dependent helicase HrpB
MIVTRVPLPIDEILSDVVAALAAHAAAVVCAPAGAGKTTRVPPALLDARPAAAKRIILVEPRRLAARAAARRMAQERDGVLGEEVGFQVRFERCWGPRSRIVSVTPGILLRLLLDDPYLEKAGVVIFDEFHERGLESDLALGQVRLVQQTVRDDLRIVVMSATLAAEPVAAYLGGCPIISGGGRPYPVDIVYEPRGDTTPLPVATATAVNRLLDRTAGDLLVFLPGVGEIRQTGRQLEPIAADRGLAVVPLYGDLPGTKQDEALLPQARRKVVLATNVAETSVTVEGVTGVVDTGLARVLTFDPGVGLNRLRITSISRASADQRAGRAGRTAPGICIRLWSQSAHHGRLEQTEPEIHRVDLAGAVLQLLACGETELTQFPWPDPPRTAAVAQALDLLKRLGAADERGITVQGRELARLPIHPRLGRLLLEGQHLGQPARAALAAALLSERDPFAREWRGHGYAARSDILERVEALEAFEADRRSADSATMNRDAARAVLRARDHLLRGLAGARSAATRRREATADDALLKALAAAFPDRVARRREPGSTRGVMVGGRGVRLAPTSCLTEAELFVCVDVDAGQGEALVRQASAVERDWLVPDRINSATELAFDEAAERVIASRLVRYEDLVLEQREGALPDAAEVGRVLSAAAARHPARVLPETDSPAGRFRTRVRCLRVWMPELKLPVLDDADTGEILAWLSTGCSSFADLRSADWLGAFRGRLTPQQLKVVDREAPERLGVPSGNQIALRYEEGRPPVLAVRIQEVFGLRETPRIAGGRVRVLMHLLAPNYRPQQVTDDIASFWANTYALVRKELRARYPKHAWPEDPLNAAPERRPTRRRPGP